MPSAIFQPASLTSLTARAIAKSIIYKDYDQCRHYRWNPATILQYEVPIKTRVLDGLRKPFRHNKSTVPPLKPAWQGIRKFRDWWWDARELGVMDSVLRRCIVTAFEQLSWMACTRQELAMFLLLRICIETKINLDSLPRDMPRWWFSDLAKIVLQLGPFRLVQLYSFQQPTFSIDGVVLEMEVEPLLISLIQQSPDLQVLYVIHSTLSRNFWSALGSHCRLLTELYLPSTSMDKFYKAATPIFQCFFAGLGREAVLKCWREGGQAPPLSFPRLKVIDLICWEEFQRFMPMLMWFYPNVRIPRMAPRFREPNCIAQPFPEVGAKVPVMTLCCSLLNIDLEQVARLVERMPYLRGLHIEGYLFILRREKPLWKLERLVTQMAAFEFLAVMHLNTYHSSLTPLQPALRARGNELISLQLSTSSFLIEENFVYQVVNLCPRLEVLVLMYSPDDGTSLVDTRTVLHPCHSLHTLAVLRDIIDDKLDDPSCFRLVRCFLGAAHNLKILALSNTEWVVDGLSTPSSDSLRLLHLEFLGQSLASHTNGDLLSFLQSLLPNFPHLKTLSLQTDDQISQKDLASLLRTGIDVIRSIPKFSFYMWYPRPQEYLKILAEYI